MIHLEENNVPDTEIKLDQDQLDILRVSNDEVHEEKPNAPTMKRFTNAIEDLVLPSFGATKSVVSYADTTLTNIFTSLLVPGAAKLTAHFHSVDVIYLDVAKAFDKVDHGVLISKLFQLGV